MASSNFSFNLLESWNGCVFSPATVRKTPAAVDADQADSTQDARNRLVKTMNNIVVTFDGLLVEMCIY